jgi:uncharacterized membrane protein
MMRLLYWMLAGVVGAAATHLVMIFALPFLAERDLTSRLYALGQANSLTLLSEVKARETISHADSAALYAICPFDLEAAPMAVIVEAGETPISLVFLGRGGSIFSALTDRAALQGLLQVRVLTPEQLNELVDSEDGVQSAGDLRLLAPQTKGVVLIKALVTLPSKAAAAKEALGRTRCGSL